MKASPEWLAKMRAEGRITNEHGVNLEKVRDMGSTSGVIAELKRRCAPVFPIVIDCPGLKVISEANRSRNEHWTTTRDRVKSQKDQLFLAIALARLAPPLIGKPVKITMTRLYSGRGKKMDGEDNLNNSMKAVRDALCVWLGIDDGNDIMLTFAYRQEKGAVGIRCVIEEV